MTDRSRELLTLLGVDGEVTEIMTTPPPSDEVGRGLASTTDEALIARLDAEPHYSLDAQLTRALGPDVERWDVDLRVIAVDERAEVQRAAGAVQRLHGRWLIDGRGSGGAIHIAPAADTPALVLLAHHGAVSVFATRVSVSDPHDDPPLDVPPIADIAGDWPIAPFILQAASALRSSPALLDRVASVGLLARLDMVVSNTPEALRRALAGDPQPRDRALAWARTIEPEIWHVVLDLATLRAQALLDDVATMSDPDSAPTPPDHFAQWLITVCRRRDELEHIAALAGDRDLPRTFDAALATLDREAATHRSVLEAHKHEMRDDILAAIACQSPNLWWGVVD